MSKRARITTTRFADRDILATACQALELTSEHATIRFFDGSEVTGTSIALPGWRYPLVIDAEGAAHYDNYEGRWGALSELNRFRQQYAAANMLAQATAANYTTLQQSIDQDGWMDIELGTSSDGGL